MREESVRTALVMGAQAVERLARARVAVFGIGGVGSYAAEALARGGVGHLALFDADCVEASNINRQLLALHSTVGRPKVEVMRERILDIDPQCDVQAVRVFYGEDCAGRYPLSAYDYIVDAVDTVSAKLLLIGLAKKAGIPVISAMGCGNKLDPSRFEVADIRETSVDPLARVMRRELAARGISGVKVVYSREPPRADSEPIASDRPGKHTTPGSVSWVPGAAGLLMAGTVIRDLTGI